MVQNLSKPTPHLWVALLCDPENGRLSEYWTHRYPLSEDLQGSSFTFDYSNGKRTVILGKIPFRPNGIIGRGTIVAEVHCSCNGDDCEWKGQQGVCNWSGQKLVMKLSFPATGRAAEDDIIRHLHGLANDKHAWVRDHLPNILHSFTTRFGENTVQGRLKKELGSEDYEERVIRGSIQEQLSPIHELKSEDEEAQVIYDVFQCHEWVYNIGCVLHRDISQANVMFRRDPDGSVLGVLNDFDLATWIDVGNRVPTSKHRTGTRPFMAHDLDDIDWKGPPGYRHDAESFFYLILILGCHYSKPGNKVQNPPYRAWFTEGDAYLFQFKHNLLVTGSLKPNTRRPGYREWLVRFHNLLFEGFGEFEKARNREEIENELDDDEDETGDSSNNFDQETLGGYFTAEKIRKVLSTFNSKALKTRDPARQIQTRHQRGTNLHNV